MNRTSRSIQRRVIRLRTITAHISPYRDGLAPETRTFVEFLNTEAAEDGYDIKFTALANRITATGDIANAARSDNLGGWFLRRSIGNGYLEGEDPVLQRGNRYWRKQLRKRDKTKAGMAEAAQVRVAASKRAEFIRDVTARNRRLYELVSAVPKAELSRLGINAQDFLRPHVQTPLRTSFPHKLKLPKRSKPPNATTWRKGGPNPRRRPDT
jgi:hypothetical protein